MRIDRRLLGWGVFLIVVGAIPLLVRGGYLDRDAIREWPTLWPLLLIGWGLGLLLRRTPGELLGSAISIVVLGVMLGGLITTGFGALPAFGACGDGTGGTPFDTRSGTFGENGRVGIEVNCGTLAVNAIDGSGWSVAGTGPQGRGPVVEADLGRLRIAPEEPNFSGFIDVASAWGIQLPRAPDLDLGVTLNAGDGTIKLTGANLDGVDMTLNAGSIILDLAGAATLSGVNGTVNAGSAILDLPAGLASANLTLNAGSMTVCLPAGAPLRVAWSGALGSNNLDAVGLARIDDQHWMTAGLNPALGPYLELNVSANAGSFTLNLGGSCDA